MLPCVVNSRLLPFHARQFALCLPSSASRLSCSVLQPVFSYPVSLTSAFSFPYQALRVPCRSLCCSTQSTLTSFVSRICSLLSSQRRGIPPRNFFPEDQHEPANH